jgi:predicted Fe-Mo cluster-binding NifX family protein
MLNLQFFDLLLEILPKKPITVCFPIQFESETGLFTIASKFNGSPNYCILNLEEREFNLISDMEILAYFKNRKDFGINTLSIDAVICAEVSPMSHKILNDNNIKVYSPVNHEIIDNLKLFILQELPLYDGKSYSTKSICSSMGCTTCPSSCN